MSVAREYFHLPKLLVPLDTIASLPIWTSLRIEDERGGQILVKFRKPVISRIVHLGMGLLICLICAGIFALLAVQIGANGALVGFDQSLENELYASATLTSTRFFTVISFFGQLVVMVFLLVITLLVVLRQRGWYAAFWLASLGAGKLLNLLLKQIVARPRPSFAAPLAVESDFSFPSGHAMVSLIAYGIIAYLLWRHFHNRQLRVAIVFAAVMVVVLIGISRLYLGVHYFSDVIAGYAAGGAWLAASITAAEALRQRRPLDGTPAPATDLNS